MTNDNNDALEMIYDVRYPDSRYDAACVVSTCLHDGAIRKRWMEPLEKGQIEPGSVGVFHGDNPDGGYAFDEQQNYWETDYDIAIVRSVDFKAQIFDKFYEYSVYSPKGGWRTLRSDAYNYGAVGSLVLLGCDDKCIGNLVTKENCYNLQYGKNLRQYGIKPRYADNKHKNIMGYISLSDGKPVMPAVICGDLVGAYWGKTYVFIPQYSPDTVAIKILRMPWQPASQPSNIVLLKEQGDGVFELEENLTQSLLNRDLDKKFKLAQHQATQAAMGLRLQTNYNK